MIELFTCNPECSLTDLSLYDWLAVVLFFIAVVFIATICKKVAFANYGYPESSFKWHAPKLIYIYLALAIVTIPPIYATIGHFGARAYGKQIYPYAGIIIYVAWLLYSEKT